VRRRNRLARRNQQHNEHPGTDRPRLDRIEAATDPRGTEAEERYIVLGQTHYEWRSDVRAVVRRIERLWPQVVCNTYVGHPWPGWDARSLDVWARPGGRGYPIPWHVGAGIRAFLLDLRSGPALRHTILGHTLWTSWGGFSFWAADDHSGDERHLHVTYW
jgi:hypothetical protein